MPLVWLEHLEHQFSGRSQSPGRSELASHWSKSRVDILSMGQQLEEGQEECHQAVYSKRPDVLVPEELVEVDQKELDEVVQKVLVEVVQKELVDVDQKELVEVVPAEKKQHTPGDRGICWCGIVQGLW